MKFFKNNIVAFLIAFSCASVYGQYENTSFLFDNENIDTTGNFKGFNEDERGYYQIGDSELKQFVVTISDIQVRFGTRFIIPKTDALNKGYTFDGEKMYGVAPLNGVFYKEYNDSIFATYFQTDDYFGANESDFILSEDGKHFLFTKELNGYYSCEKIVFKGSKMIVSSLDHEEVMDKLFKMRTIHSKSIQGVKTYIANPKLEELIEFASDKGFTDINKYSKIKKL